MVCFATVHKVVMDTSSGTPTATGVEFGLGNRGEKGTFTGENHSHHNQQINVPSCLQQLLVLVTQQAWLVDTRVGCGGLKHLGMSGADTCIGGVGRWHVRSVRRC